MRSWARLAFAGAVACALVVGGPAHSFGDEETYPTVDGQFSGNGPIHGGSVVNLTVVGRGGVPLTGVEAVALNVTATRVNENSYLTVFPTGAPRPLAANLTVRMGATAQNMVIVKVGTGGQVSIYNHRERLDVVVDVLGWFPIGSGFVGLTPARLVDTRSGEPTIDGRFAGGGRVGPGGVLSFAATGRGGVPATGVGAVALNVTVANGTAQSFLTAYPTGEPRPNSANLNFYLDHIIGNMVTIKVGADGQVSLFNYGGHVDVIVDVLGWFSATESFVGVTPARLLDTRPGYSTIDGAFQGGGALGGVGGLDAPEARRMNLTVTGRGGVPATGVGAVALNVTVTESNWDSYLKVYPTGMSEGISANINFTTGQTVPNMAIVQVGVDGQVTLYNYTNRVHVVVDVLGWFPGDGAFRGLAPVRLMDSRRPWPEQTCPPGSYRTGASPQGDPYCEQLRG